MPTLPLRDRRHQQAKNDLTRLETQRDATLDKLARIAARLKATRRSIERYERTPTLPAAKPAEPVNVRPPTPAPAPQAAAPATASAGVDLEIPYWLKRAGKIGDKTPADIAALAEIGVEQANKRIAKSRARIDKMKAKASGDTKKMPLTGREALNYLRTGTRAGK